MNHQEREAVINKVEGNTLNFIEDEPSENKCKSCGEPVPQSCRYCGDCIYDMREER